MLINLAKVRVGSYAFHSKVQPFLGNRTRFSQFFMAPIHYMMSMSEMRDILARHNHTVISRVTVMTKKLAYEELM